jgi:hypothetical protein
MITYLDLDGVCADFHASASRLAGVPTITTPAHRALGESNACTYRLEDRMGDDIWQRIEHAGESFWSGLEPTPWLDAMFELVAQASDEVFVLSSPGHLAASAVPGKVAWCRKYLPHIPVRNLIFTGHKHFLAHGDRLLIDDADDMVERFAAHGGLTWRLPQPWNEGRADTIHPVPDLLRAHLRAIG